jgi:hypothetical protein
MLLFAYSARLGRLHKAMFRKAARDDICRAAVLAVIIGGPAGAV